MVSHFVAVCLALLPFAQCIQIHKYMTEEEVLNTFQTRHDNVPEYEVVRLYHTLHKRAVDDGTVKMNALGRDLSLYLKPTKGLLAGESTPVWTVVEHVGWPNGTKYTRQRNILAKIGRAYQDVSTRSAVVAYTGKYGETLFQGNVLDNFSILPVPYRLRNTVQRERRDVVDVLPEGVDGDADFQRSHYHIVFKRPEEDLNVTRDGIRVVERQKRQFTILPMDGLPEASISIPDIIYPEVLVVVDFSLYKAIGKNLEGAVRYILAFWNAVDLRYRLLEKPVIRLNIAGIIISLQPRGTPYLENARRGSNELDAYLGIKAMSRYFYAESYRFPFDSYDFAVAMTHHDMCNLDDSGFCVTSTAGYAFRPGACTTIQYLKETHAVAIIEDSGSFKGVLAAAHEAAHLMGVPHDGSPDSTNCPPSDGYLMTPRIKFQESAFQWSTCSLQHLYAFLRKPESSCLHNEPRGGKALPRQLPGALLTVDEQCEKIRGTRACYDDERVCTALACFDPGSDTRCGIISAAPEGTSCGVEMHCINGYCVSKNERYVPFERKP